MSNNIFNLYFVIFMRWVFCPLILEKCFFFKWIIFVWWTNWAFFIQINVVLDENAVIGNEKSKRRKRQKMNKNDSKTSFCFHLEFKIVLKWHEIINTNGFVWFYWIEYFYFEFHKKSFCMMSLKNEKVEQTEKLFK